MLLWLAIVISTIQIKHIEFFNIFVSERLVQFKGQILIKSCLKEMYVHVPGNICSITQKLHSLYNTDVSVSCECHVQ